jgi:hypothetical protein
MMKTSLLPLLSVALTACFGADISRTTAVAEAPQPTEEPAKKPGAFRSQPAPARTPFVVHEWGTFTSLQGSDGVAQAGMHHEEEALPAFVYGRVPRSGTAGPVPKSVEGMLVDGITQKLETPVIYFYGAPPKVDVAVDFPRGVISQWYPKAASYAPEVNGAVFSPDGILNGRMTWSLDVLGYGETSGMIDVPADDVWAPSRDVEAQPVRVGEEVEKFIFYRGLGRFETPFRVTSTRNTIELHNPSDQQISDAWILHWNGERGAVWPLGPLDPNEVRTFSPTPKELPQADYLETARRSVAEGLVRSGLTEDESWAMVDTWNRSYFQSTGMRVLYVVPRVWTDELLPITITPEPDELVRTLLGRVEVLTDTDEQALLEQLRSSEPTVAELGRFAEPRLRRLLELNDDDGLEARIQSLLLKAQAP